MTWRAIGVLSVSKTWSQTPQSISNRLMDDCLSRAKVTHQFSVSYRFYIYVKVTIGLGALDALR